MGIIFAGYKPKYKMNHNFDDDGDRWKLKGPQKLL